MLEAATLKELARTGWVRRGVPTPESVAAHSWGVSWLVMALAPPALDRGKALAYAALHDLAEVRVGDLTPADGVARATKRRLEHDALRGLLEGLGARAEELRQTVAAYEAQADPEARLVRQLDRLDMAVQAVVYADRTGADLREFVASARSAITDPALIDILNVLDRRVAGSQR